MSTPAGQQLPHQPSVLLDAVLNVHLLLLQGNTVLSLPVAPALIWPLGFLPGAVHKSPKQHSPFGEWGALVAWQSSGTNSCTGKGNPTPRPLQSDRVSGRWVQELGGESPQIAPRLLGCSPPAVSSRKQPRVQSCEPGYPPRAPSSPCMGRGGSTAPRARVAAGQRPFLVPLVAGACPVTS